MFLTDSTAELLRTGAERIYTFGQPWQWDGRWLLVVLRVPENRREVRHQLRTRLAWAGLGSLGGGFWLTPHVDREHEVAAVMREEPAAEVLSFHARLADLGEPMKVVQAAWDLDAIIGQYQAFIEDFSRANPSSLESCFRMQTELVHAWRRFPFLDPYLPASSSPRVGPEGARTSCSRAVIGAGPTARAPTSRGSRPREAHPLGRLWRPVARRSVRVRRA